MTDLIVTSTNRKLSASLLFTPILSVFLFFRVVTLLIDGFELSEVLVTRAVISDICVAAVLAFLISFTTIRYLQLILAALICILGSANVEHILANGANMDVAFSKYLTEFTFFSGSLLTLNFALLVAISIVIFFSVVAYLGKKQTGEMAQLFIFDKSTVIVGILFAISSMLLMLVPVKLLSASWTQVNFLEENLKSYFNENNSQNLLVAKNTDIAESIYYQDLSGQTLLPKSRKKNVVLILVEGISQVHLSQGLMPLLEKSRSNHFSISKYIANQRQTNRGLYSLLCGRYPNLVDKAAKSDIVNAFGPSDPCLPQLLKESGYHTVFMQSAELGFMRKDLFAEAVGFNEYFGDSDYKSARSRTDWGVDDYTLYEYAEQKMSKLSAQKKPWFLTLLTSGTHHPFNNPEGPNTQKGALAYADKSLQKFIELVVSNNLTKDTLFIISSDEASTGTSVDLDNLISSNWAPLIIIDDKIDISTNDSVFSHVDMPLSILDYLSIDIPTSLYGRSIFRRYDTPRTIYFANVYTGLLFALRGDSALTACNRSLICSQYSTSNNFFQYPLSDLTEVPIKPAKIEHIRDVIKYSDQRYADFGQRPIFSLTEKEFSSKDRYVLLSQFKVPLKKGMTLNFEIDIANNIASVPGKLMAELIYYECPRPITSHKNQLFIAKNEISKIRALKIVANQDMSICSFLTIHSETKAKWELLSLSVKLSS